MPIQNDLSDMTYDFVSLVDFPANRPSQVVLAKRDVSKGGEINSTDEDSDAAEEEKDAIDTLRAANLRRLKMSKANDTPSTTHNTPASTNPETTDDEGGVAEKDETSTKPTATGGNPGAAAKRGTFFKGGQLSATNLDVGEEEDDQSIEGASDDESARSPHETGRLLGATRTRTSKGAQSPMPQTRSDLPEVITKADLDRIMKGYEDRVEKAEARAAAAEELAKAEADKIAKRESVAKSETWLHIPQLTSAEFSDHWLAISKSLPESAAILEKIFDATEAALAAGASIYRSNGRATTGSSVSVSKGGDPMAPITAAAGQIRKAQPNLTMQQAIVKVMQSQPDLAEAYRQSMGFIPEGGYQPA